MMSVRVGQLAVLQGCWCVYTSTKLKAATRTATNDVLAVVLEVRELRERVFMKNLAKVLLSDGSVGWVGTTGMRLV